MEFHKDSEQWIPRGQVLRCIVDDGGPEGEATILIDDKEFSPAEFGQLLKFYAGWGMRIAFVPEELVAENPEFVVREPQKGRRR